MASDPLVWRGGPLVWRIGPPVHSLDITVRISRGLLMWKRGTPVRRTDRPVQTKGSSMINEALPFGEKALSCREKVLP